VDAQLQVLAELLVELLVVLLVLGDFLEQLHGLLDDVLADDLEDLRLLQHLSGDVQWQVLGVDNTTDEVEVLGHELLAVLHDEHTAHVQLDRVLLLLVLEEIERGALWHEQQRSELQLALDREVLDGQMVLPVVGERLVEVGVLGLRDVLWVAGPQGLCLVELLLLAVLLLDLLCLLGLLLALFVLIDLLDLWLLLLFALLLLLGLLVLLWLLLLVVADLLLALLLAHKLDRVADELRVLLHDLLDLLLIVELNLIL